MIVPFCALRFDDPHSDQDGVLDVDSVVAPAAIRDDAALRQEFVQRSSYNIANALEKPELLRDWETHGWLRRDQQPAMYLYRIGFTGTDGMPAQWSGVFGRVKAAGDAPPNAQLFPQRISVSAEGFSELLSPVGLMPLARATDDRGAHHRLWAIEQAGVIDLITDAIGKHGQPLPADLASGTLVLAGEATQAEYAPALGFVLP